ncbi:MAG TPA: helix-turn-helix domain-containing protein [Limnochordia bacterium]|nr:helix-turn-helix domain-containing protein [Limnochordia bacterium]
MSQTRVQLSGNIAVSAALVFSSGRRTERPAFRLGEHAHADAWQADRVLSGILEYGIAGRTVTCGPGEICFIPPGVRHSLTSATGLYMQAIKFQAPLLAGESPYLRVSAESRVRAELADEVFGVTGELPWCMDCRYLGALLRLMDASATLGERPETAAGEPPDPIAGVIAQLRDHPAAYHSVGDLAERVHLSVPHFARRFRAATGLPPGRWIAEQRLRRAAELLRYGDLPISRVAVEVGYSDLPTFSKAFRRNMGLSPTEYRSASWLAPL